MSIKKGDIVGRKSYNKDIYFIIDKSIIYHCGRSLNRIGHKIFSINLINDEIVCTLLITKLDTIIKYK